MIQEPIFHKVFYKIFKFKWRNPFITFSKILFKGRYPKRVLGIWDFENGRAAIGDTIIFHEILLIIAKENNLNEIDICFVNPEPSGKNIYQSTDKMVIENIISVSKVNPQSRSIFMFDDNDQFSWFFNYFKHKYIVFPNPYLPFATVSNWHHLTEFFERNQYIPKLCSDDRDLKWAYEFTEKYCSDKVPITVSLRKNTRDSGRNANIEQWILFFDFVANKYPQFNFLVIGTKEEIVPELLDRDNLIFAKRETESTLLQDLALIEASKAYVGHESGVSFFPWFIDKPALVLGVDQNNVHFGHALKKHGQYNFSTDKQKIFWGDYSVKDIIDNFEKFIVS